MEDDEYIDFLKSLEDEISDMLNDVVERREQEHGEETCSS